MSENQLMVYQGIRKSNIEAEKGGQDEKSCNLTLVTGVPKQAAVNGEGSRQSLGGAGEEKTNVS